MECVFKKEEELKVRKKCIDWFDKTFTNDMVQIHNSLSLDSIWETYERLRKSGLSLEEFRQILYWSGRINGGLSNSGYIVDKVAVSSKSIEEMEILMSICPMEMRGTIQKMITRKANKIATPNYVEQEIQCFGYSHLELFFHMWCINATSEKGKKFVESCGLTRKQTGTSLKALKSAYTCFCETFTVPMRFNASQLKHYFEQKGFEIKKGYVCGVAGQTYFDNLIVPGWLSQDAFDLPISITCKNGIIFKAGVYWDITLGQSFIDSDLCTRFSTLQSAADYYLQFIHPKEEAKITLLANQQGLDKHCGVERTSVGLTNRTAPSAPSAPSTPSVPVESPSVELDLCKDCDKEADNCMSCPHGLSV